VSRWLVVVSDRNPRDLLFRRASVNFPPRVQIRSQRGLEVSASSINARSAPYGLNPFHPTLLHLY